MESTGTKNKIQISSATAELLSAAGKDWMIPREEKVIAKGKGELQTYYLKIPARSDENSMDNTSRSDEESSLDDAPSLDLPNLPGQATSTSLNLAQNTADKSLPDKIRRLVQWNVDILN